MLTMTTVTTPQLAPQTETRKILSSSPPPDPDRRVDRRGEFVRFRWPRSPASSAVKADRTLGGTRRGCQDF
ncbi:hypothetical protein [Oxynema aestuarii]|uniref:Uncharacterized protein n=1 Tax=Oxynema aestuarii AP17 TaxID=2064643 RepID=A0A6H1TZ35_9CYAN|nr:hypothetical protein [Oxynema aestuarii]QIZ71841.1 hypothetical protein HCG48_15670 [Oxynema aestuarii AP17]